MVGKNIGHGGFMIEIKNIVKTYRPKKGGEVKALDDVSLKFPEKGLVFILGKSGSGKSTLLNVMGGLTRRTAAKSSSKASRPRSSPRAISTVTATRISVLFFRNTTFWKTSTWVRISRLR